MVSDWSWLTRGRLQPPCAIALTVHSRPPARPPGARAPPDTVKQTKGILPAFVRQCLLSPALPRWLQSPLVPVALLLSWGLELDLTIDLKESSSCVHPVENGEGHGQVDHNNPGFKAKDDFLQSVVILRAAAKGGGDPELKEKGQPSVTISPNPAEGCQLPLQVHWQYPRGTCVPTGQATRS